MVVDEEYVGDDRMTMRMCNKCGKELPLEQFVKTESWEGGRRRICKNCYNAYQRRQYVKRGERLVANPPDLKSLQVCNACGKELPLRRFMKNAKSKGGRTSTCRDCYNAQTRERYRQGSLTAAQDRDPVVWRAKLLRRNMVQRVRQKKLPFDRAVLTRPHIEAWLLRTPNCPCCGRPFDFTFKHDGVRHDDAPSLDRFDPAKGYVVGNVTLICWRCNRVKGTTTVPDELEAVARWIRKRQDTLPEAPGDFVSGFPGGSYHW